jgi:hypothetical protein
MNVQTRKRFEIVGFACAFLTMTLSISQLINKDNDAILLTALLGAFAAGAMFSNLLQSRKRSASQTRPDAEPD